MSAEVAPPRGLSDVFSAIVARFPTRIAIDVPPAGARPRRRLTYAALATRVEALRARLTPFVARGRIVALLLPREDPDLFAAELAAMAAGAAYTALDASFPDERLRFILRDADVAACIADAEGAARLRALGFEPDRILTAPETAPDAPALARTTHSGSPPAASRESAPGPSSPPAAERVPAAATALAPAPGRDADLAYVIYTSGTTGAPKGVLIEQRSILGLVLSDVAEFALGPEDRVAQGSSHAYDSSLEETWLAFAVGATVVPLDDETARSGPDLVRVLRDEKITVFCPPPTQLRATGCADPARELPRLRLLYVGGEALTEDVVRAWAPGRRLVNGYGPTECTVTVVRGDVAVGEPITIGKPTPEHRAYVLDPSGRPVADGELGELWIGGRGLARGYLGRPELDAEKFPVHPEFGRLYRTGDAVVRRSDGRLDYRGRLDAQVKFRGYRLELEAIETALTKAPGVAAAACRVQEDASGASLVACIVPTDAARPPEFSALRSRLANELPHYSVPGRFACVAALPRTTGGKLDRRSLPYVAAPGVDVARDAAATDDDPLTAAVAAAFGRALGLGRSAPAHADFFTELGGDSLRAAEAVSQLRRDPHTASLAVRDLYEARTASATAARAARSAADVPEEAADSASQSDDATSADGGRPALAAALQAVWIAARVLVRGAAAAILALHLAPATIEALGPAASLAAAPFVLAAAAILGARLSVAAAVGVKRLLIGRYVAGEHPVWGSFYVRHWMTQAAVRAVPWRLLAGTEFENAALRALGARVGRRVELRRGAELSCGAFDLLRLDDDVVVGRDAALRTIELTGDRLVLGPVTLERGARLETRAAAEAFTTVGEDATVRPLATVLRGACVPPRVVFDGMPGGVVGPAPPPSVPDPGDRDYGPHGYGARLVIARALAEACVRLTAWSLTAAAASAVYGVGTADLAAWFAAPAVDARLVGALVWLVPLEVAAELVGRAVLCRALGRTEPGTVARFGPRRLRAELKIEQVEEAGKRLSGTLFWPVFLRGAGMRVGRDCEVSTILDTTPDLVSLGGRSFFADGVYLAGPRIDRGGATFARVSTGEETFVGNHAVLPAGVALPPGVLIGVCTVADDPRIRAGTSWFGAPALELGRRPATGADERLTHRPSWIRYCDRVCWEAARFWLPIVPAVVIAAAYAAVAAAETAGPLRQAFWHAPLAFASAQAFMVALVLVAKWALLGRVRPGEHPLWSCWCSRWDFHYVMWADYARGALASLEGTPFLTAYLRAMGCRIGKRVVLGGGFAQVVDPDMLIVEDGAAVAGHLQAHTFEDRVLKIAPVRIGARAEVAEGAVLFYGADVGARASVLPHAVVMKNEALLPGVAYEGAPVRPARPRAPAADLLRRTAERDTPSPSRLPGGSEAAAGGAPLGPPRAAELDAVRGAALLGMLYMHFVPVEPGTGFLAEASAAFARLLYGKSAALFFTVLGASLAMRARRPGFAGLRDRGLWLRAAILFAGGQLLAATVWPTEVLRAAAVATLVVATFAGRSPTFAAAVAAAAVAASPFVVAWAAPYASDVDDDGVHRFVAAGGATFLRGLFLNGPYPLLGWIAFPAFGAFLARVAHGSRRALERTFFFGLGVCTAMHLVLGATGAGEFEAGHGPWWAPEWTPANATFLVLNAAFAAAAIAGVRWFVLAGPPDAATPLALRALGRTTLTHYVLHLLVPFAILRRYYPEEDWPAEVGLAVAGAYVAFAVWISRRFVRAGGGGPLERLSTRLAAPYRRP